MVAQKVIEGVFDGVTTTELDNLAAETAASLTTRHPDFAQLASRIAISNLHKNTKKGFTETMRDLYTFIDPKTGKNASLIAEDVMQVIEDNTDLLDSSIIYDRDFGYDYFRIQNFREVILITFERKSG
jgi:ribonucleoside-diphosphate reductase alpha chain